MRVRVTIPEHMSSSYAGKRVYNGEIIKIDAKHFSEKWMVKIEEKLNPNVEEKPITAEVNGAESKKSKGKPMVRSTLKLKKESKANGAS